MDDPTTTDPGTPTSSLQGLRAVRLVCDDSGDFQRLVEFYTRVLGREPDDSFGVEEDLQRGTVFRLEGGVDLILVLEEEPPPEAYVEQGPLWLCFACRNAGDLDALHLQAQARGADLLNDPIDTAFGTRGFYVGDPDGRPVYVGTSWPRHGA